MPSKVSRQNISKYIIVQQLNVQKNFNCQKNALEPNLETLYQQV